jgi:hypothetical protein
MSGRNDQDGTYEACLSYLDAKGFVLWGDYSLNPNRNDDGTPKNRSAARWLEAQVRGVADHYDTPANPAPPYAGPYNTKHSGDWQRPSVSPSVRPSALITHGQQPERW